ncbi:MAG: hypothetical protein PWR03_1887, partial [Tenuifilum sp.]|nr:hypothetical protein [Tenuifilum sp.]
GLEIIFPFSNVSKPHFPNSLYFLIGFGIFIFLTSFFSGQIVLLNGFRR